MLNGSAAFHPCMIQLLNGARLSVIEEPGVMQGRTALSSWLLPARGQFSQLWKHAGLEYFALPCVQLSACMMAESETELLQH